jgi:DNA-binding IclR family transcriptional regulator
LQRHPFKSTARKSLRKKDELLKLLSQIRKQGFVLDNETAMDGISGVAAPIHDLNGKAIGAIGVAFISSSADSKEIKKIAKETVMTAQNISRDMGYFEKNEIPAQETLY